MATDSPSLLDRALQQIKRNSVSLKRATWNAVVITGSTAVARLCAFATSVLLARISGVATFGEYTLFTTVFVLVAESPNTLDTTYIRFSNAPGDDARYHSFLATNLLTKIVYMLVVTMIAYLFGTLLAERVFGKPGSVAIIRDAALAGGLYVIFVTLIAVYQRQLRFVRVSFLRIIFNLLILTGVGFLVWRGLVPTQSDISALYFYSAIGLTLISLLIVVRQIASEGGFAIYRRMDYYKIASILFLADVINMSTNRLDVFFLSSFMNFEDIGLYGAAIRISVVVSLMTVTISTVMLPKAAAALQDRMKLRRFIAHALFYAVVQTCIAVLVIIYMQPIMDILFGARYTTANDAASLLVLQILLTAYGSPFQALIQCGPHPSRMFYISLARPLLSVPLLPPMIQHYGLTGAAFTVATTAGVVSALMAAAAWYTVRAGKRF